MSSKSLFTGVLLLSRLACAEPDFVSLQKKLVYSVPDNLLTDIKDQGARGTCTDFVITDLVQQHYLIQSPTYKNLNLSVQCLMGLRDWMFDTPSYTGTDKPQQRPDGPAGDTRQAIQTIMTYGIPVATNYSPAIDCRYSQTQHPDVSMDQYERALASSPNPAEPLGKGLKIVLRNRPSFDEIKKLISKNTPVGIGVVLFKENEQAETWAWLPSWGKKHNQVPSHIDGEHAVELVGYTSDGYFMFKNSWGADWGNHGFGFISEEFIKNGWSAAPPLDFMGYVEQ